jgi:hypothetical protein
VFCAKRLALVLIEVSPNLQISLARVGQVRFELRIARLAYAEHEVPHPFYDPELGPWHESSLAQLADRAQDLWISNGTYRNFEVYVQNAPVATMEPERLKEVV